VWCGEFLSRDYGCALLHERFHDYSRIRNRESRVSKEKATLLPQNQNSEPAGLMVEAVA
jgi:hypothetical protein